MGGPSGLLVGLDVEVQLDVVADEDPAGLERDVPDQSEVLAADLRGALEADLGVASGNGKGQIFVKGEVIKTVPEEDIVQTLIDEANRIAREMEERGEIDLSGDPTVSVSN